MNKMMTTYYTRVIASGEFWKELIKGRLPSGFPITLNRDEDEFTLTSKYGPAIWDLIELSRQYPDEHFYVIVTTDNNSIDVTEYYGFHNGAYEFLDLEPEYHFKYTDQVKQQVDSEIIERFQKEVTEALNRVVEFQPSYEKVMGIQNNKNELISNIQFEYGHEDTGLLAKVIGKTFIKIDLASTDNYKNNIYKK